MPKIFKMLKLQIVKVAGICFIPITFVIGVTSFPSPYNTFSAPFMILGWLLSLILIGIGEIIITTKKGSGKNE